MQRPAFLITIDTEGDNLWARPREITTENAAFLSRFQELCETYKFKPAYLTNWEMAAAPVFQEFGRDVIRRGTGEIGMHPHAWNSPPLDSLTDDDFTHLPFLTEYPEGQMRDKIRALTDKLETTFGVKMHSHRAGRWGFNEVYARILSEMGYLVDCSVTPHVSWRSMRGDPRGTGGPDFTRFPSEAYFLDLDDISRAGRSRLLELPVTIIKRQWPATVETLRRFSERLAKGRRGMERIFPVLQWLRPDGTNRDALLSVLNTALAEKRDYVEFMLHSSEFMPGGSPIFSTPESIEALYDDVEAVFSVAAGHFAGLTLAEYYQRFRGYVKKCG
ncbi:MAG: deacetylase [Candidatus Latescibacterota bacterium]